MKGLILKEFVFMKGYIALCFCIMLCLALFMSLSVAQSPDAQSVQPGFPGLMVGVGGFLGTIMCAASFSFDEPCRWDEYVLTLPVTRRQAVLAKYLFALLLMGVEASICGIIATAVFVASGAGIGIESAQTAIAVLSMSVIVTGVNLPLFYKLGIEKGRAASVLIGVLVMMVFLRFLPRELMGSGALVFLFPAMAAVVLALSYRISCRVYENSDSVRAKKTAALPRLRKL